MYAFKLEPKVSAEAYLEAERQADQRSEWHEGVVIQMAGASPEHIDIVDNMTYGIRLRLKDRSCRTATHDLRVKTSTSYVYPDVVVTCGERRYTDNDCLTNPLVIVEVLSDSTEKADRGWKMAEYRNLPSVQEIVYIYQDRIQVECLRRQDATHWLYDVFIHLEAELTLESLGVTLPLQDIYQNVVPDEVVQQETDDPA